MTKSHYVQSRKKSTNAPRQTSTKFRRIRRNLMVSLNQKWQKNKRISAVMKIKISTTKYNQATNFWQSFLYFVIWFSALSNSCSVKGTFNNDLSLSMCSSVPFAPNSLVSADYPGKFYLLFLPLKSIISENTQTLSGKLNVYSEKISQRKKVSVLVVILVRIFPYFRVSLRIQTECGKKQTRITPNKYTFHAVYVCWRKGSVLTK